ncbi:hypothetical protein FH621_08660 [Latilactobacillus curvatus]|uniref:hypothetical protein n=1 Tax=Latilactobacillus curvatus TaxID=28038 RepID=UPI00217DBF5A|nr:hypothetical protein [Latilactobacillus curvatus]MCS6143599.1 hypothetical protein [Latilactobacillus curvatus]
MKSQIRIAKEARKKAFEPVMGKIFELCSDRINRRIDLILRTVDDTNETQNHNEKDARASLKYKIIENKEGKLAGGLDEDVVSHIIDGKCEPRRNLYLFPTKSAKEYYAAFRGILWFDGVYEILWGTITEITAYLPMIFRMLCNAELEWQNELSPNPKKENKRTTIKQVLSNFDGDSIDEQIEHAYTTISDSFFLEWMKFTTLRSDERNFTIADGSPNPTVVTPKTIKTRIDDTEENQYRGFYQLNIRLSEFANNQLYQVLTQGIMESL